MSVLHESKLTLRLALPLIIGQVSQMLLGVADSVMVGKLGVTELASLTFVNSIFWIPFVFGIGVLTCISVLTSTARGAGDAQRARGSCRNGLYISLGISVCFLVIGLALLPLLGQLGQPAAVVELSRPYLVVLMCSIVPGLASIALKNHADALDRPWPPFWIFLAGVAFNVWLNWVLIYGKWGAPEMGMMGAAWATLVSRVLMFLAMLLWLEKDRALQDWVPFTWFRKPTRGELLAHARIGVPASFQMLCEVAAFSAAGLMMGRFGEVSMAAHQIAITCAGTAFMVPLGLSMALSVRVGAVAGSGETARLRGVVKSGWLLAGGFGAFNALLFFVGGAFWARQFTNDPAVIHTTATLLIIVGVFQLFDSLQVASSSMLRGLHDTKVPALMGFVAYWLVGLPVAAGLSGYGSMAARGVWWGLATGLLIACVTLAPRLLYHLRKQERAIAVDAGL
jgi:MATE family multidrug resistance protein